VLRAALEGHPHVAVRFHYHAGRSDAMFSSRVAPAGAQSATIDLHNGWTVQSFAAASASGMLSDRNALTLLLGGTILSLLVGRLGGDEFVVLLDSSSGEPRPDRVAERLVNALRRPVSLANGKVAAMSASVGIAVGSRRTVDQLLRDADLALYAAKAAGKDRYMLYEAGMGVNQVASVLDAGAMSDTQGTPAA